MNTSLLWVLACVVLTIPFIVGAIRSERRYRAAIVPDWWCAWCDDMSIDDDEAGECTCRYHCGAKCCESNYNALIRQFSSQIDAYNDEKGLSR